MKRAAIRRTSFRFVDALRLFPRQRCKTRERILAFTDQLDLDLAAAPDPAPTTLEPDRAKQIFANLKRVEPRHVADRIEAFGVERYRGHRLAHRAGRLPHWFELLSAVSRDRDGFPRFYLVLQALDPLRNEFVSIASEQELRRRIVGCNQAEDRGCEFVRVADLLATFFLPRFSDRIKQRIVIGNRPLRADHRTPGPVCSKRAGAERSHLHTEWGHFSTHNF
ncbi:hypothetical protein FVER53590_26461 [Fusarium verticillioides]|nr:hypothetical protein FVER53590_26461 [Fusarium verticillioides]